MKPLKIAINIQLPLGGKVGGAEQFLIGLIHGLGELLDSNEEYLLITSPQAVKWLKQYTGPNQQIIKNPFEAAKNADVLALVTEWPEFSEIDFKKNKKLMRCPYILDGRNQFEPEEF